MTLQTKTRGLTPEEALLRYRKILEWAFSEGAVHALPDKEERRKNPRIKLPAGIFHAQETVARDLIDVSLGGFAFFASRMHRAGESVTVTLGSAVETTASVLDCEEAGDAALEPGKPYRVRCKFQDEDEALTLFTMAMQMSGLIPEEVWGSEPAAPT